MHRCASSPHPQHRLRALYLARALRATRARRPSTTGARRSTSAERHTSPHETEEATPPSPSRAHPLSLASFQSAQQSQAFVLKPAFILHVQPKLVEN
ncbi:hypothetical protein MHYP_G00302910 [Metynnis hypsauchen]